MECSLDAILDLTPPQLRLLLRVRSQLTAEEDVRRGQAVAMGSQWAWSGKKGGEIFRRWARKLTDGK